MGGVLLFRFLFLVFCFLNQTIKAGFIILALLSRSLPVGTQIRGRIAGPPAPLFPLQHACLHFYREKSSAFSFLVDSRRIVLLLCKILLLL